jgi:hypothetical protein
MTYIKCPLCGDAASNRTPAGFDGLVIRCNGCRDYDVSGPALEKLQGLRVSERLEVLREARELASIGTRPSITMALKARQDDGV